MTAVLSIEDAIRERQLKRLMQRIKEAQDRETRLVLWDEYKALHGARSPEQIEEMERGWADGR